MEYLGIMVYGAEVTFPCYQDGGMEEVMKLSKEQMARLL